jgi:hypothetical protein
VTDATTTTPAAAPAKRAYKPRGSNSRVYVIGNKRDHTERLVKATQRHVAERHVSMTLLTSRVATQADLVRLITAGTHVEDASPAAEDTTE